MSDSNYRRICEVVDESRVASTTFVGIFVSRFVSENPAVHPGLVYKFTRNLWDVNGEAL